LKKNQKNFVKNLEQGTRSCDVIKMNIDEEITKLVFSLYELMMKRMN